MKKILLSIATVALSLPAMAGTVTFDFTTDNYGLPPFNEDTQEADYVLDVPRTITSGDVEIILNGEVITSNNNNTTTGPFRMWHDGLREYYKNSPEFTVKTTNGENVTKVSWTVVSGATFALEGTTDNITSWIGDAESVTFVGTATANKAIKTITVVYGEVPEEDPDVTPDIPSYPGGVVSVAEAVRLMQAGYTGHATVTGLVSEVVEFNESYGDMNYYIMDADEDYTLYVYNGYGLNGDKFTSASDLEVGQTVIVDGELIVYNDIYEFARGSKILEDSADIPGPAAPAIFSETFDTSLGNFQIQDVEMPDELTYVWSWAANYGAKATAYKGGNLAASSWLISPAINLEGYSDVTLSFDNAVNYANGETISDLCKVFVGETATPDDTWTEVICPAYPSGSNWTFVNSGEISLEAWEGKTIYIGFLYTSTSEVAPTWEIKNLVVNGSEDAGVENIGIDNNAPVKYYNLQGVKVNNPAKGGIYIVNGKKVILK